MLFSSTLRFSDFCLDVRLGLLAESDEAGDDAAAVTTVMFCSFCISSSRSFNETALPSVNTPK